MRTVWLDDHHFNLFMTTSAGTYVKEFVHGDRERTRPNVGRLLGCEADILQLDVVELMTAAPEEEGGSDEEEEDGE